MRSKHIKLKRFLICHLLDIHQVTKTGNDGVNDEGICELCNRKCLRDSHNSWFLTEGRNKLEHIIDILFVILIITVVLILCS